MDNQSPPYPPMPVGSNSSVIKPSPAFKKQVYLAIGTIVLFVVVYLVLVACALALAAGAAWLGVKIMGQRFGLMGYVIGLALISLGAWLVFFLVKFIFTRAKKTNIAGIQIKTEDYPALMQFIEKVAAEVGSPKPKKIFFSPDASAFVFFDSRFWSMFFPVGKNLSIGLALVNSINLSEFKAVLAHEFGHFSQRSMKLGGYVQNVNKVIFNMLHENAGYDKWLNKWASLHSMFRAMALINIYLIKGIQSILKDVYIVVNKTYMGLSRQMEYHADTISAYTAGSNIMSSGLARSGIAELCYQNTLNYLSAKLEEKKRADNIYAVHLEMTRLYAAKQNFKIDLLGLPVVDQQTARIINDRIEPDDPWSSHPLTEDREKHLENLSLLAQPVDYPAWSVFGDAETLQRQFTELLYNSAKGAATADVVAAAEFSKDLFSTFNTHRYNEIFKDFLDDREISKFDLEYAIAGLDNAPLQSIDELLSDENCKIPAEISKRKENIDILEQIIEIRKDVKYFYYLAAKLSREQGESLTLTLQNEITALKQKLQELDKEIFVFFYRLCKDDSDKKQLVAKYRLLFEVQADANDDFANYRELARAMSPVYGRMKPAEIRATINEVYRKEKIVKPRLKLMVADEAWQTFINESNLDALKVYLKTNWVYYLDPEYDNNAINVFNKGMKAYADTVSQRVFSVKKDLLDFEAALLVLNKS